MARKTMTRADMIALLKSRGQKGALSKMTKAKLKTLIENTAPPDDEQHGSDRPSGDLELEPDEHQKGGHYFDKTGKPRAARHARHTHEKSTWPVSQDGSGSGHGYRDFMKTHLKQYGGSMQKAAAAYREQQKGGHFVKRNGSPGRGEDGNKYHHKHTPDKNPAQSGGHYATVKGAPAKGEGTKYKHSHTPSANAAKGKAAAAAPAPKPAASPKPAPKKSRPARKPKDLSKIPDSMLTDAERRQKKAAADAEAAKEKTASRERRRKVAEEEERTRKEAEEGERRYRERVGKREADKKKAKADATARKRAAVSKAKATLKSGKPMNAYQRFAAEQRSRGVTDLKLIGRAWGMQKEREERVEQEERDRSDDAEFARQERSKLPKVPKKQRGKGMEQDGSGFLDDIEGAYKSTKTWVGRAAGKVKGAYDDTEAYIDKHPMLHDLQDGAIAIGGVALASTGVGFIGEAALGAAEAGEVAAGAAEAAEAAEGAEGAAEGAEGAAEEPGVGDPDEVDDLLAGIDSDAGAAGADGDAGAAGADGDAADAGGKKTFGQTLRGKLPGAKEIITGLAVGDAQTELRDEETTPPPSPTPPAPGPGTQQPPPLPPGYFEHLHDAESFSANSKALGESVPQPFLNPWYS